jgi:hypothetical protein
MINYDGSRDPHYDMIRQINADARAIGTELLSAVDDELQPSVASMIVELRQHSAGIGVGTFDIVSGLAGIAAYLLRHDRHGQLPQVLAALVWLLESTGGPPRWATPPEWLEAGMRIQYPAGNLNCGLAHGIPGPLAVLALAMRSGQHVTGQADVMRRTAEWRCSAAAARATARAPP